MMVSKAAAKPIISAIKLEMKCLKLDLVIGVIRLHAISYCALEAV